MLEWVNHPEDSKYRRLANTTTTPFTTLIHMSAGSCCLRFSKLDRSDPLLVLTRVLAPPVLLSLSFRTELMEMSMIRIVQCFRVVMVFVVRAILPCLARNRTATMGYDSPKPEHKPFSHIISLPIFVNLQVI